MNARSLVLAAALGVMIIAGSFLLTVPLGPQAASSASPDVVATLVGAGDIAGCEGTSDSDTARLLDRIPGTVFTLGDNAYPDGSVAAFEECYGPTWGRHRHRTRPTPGNHDYRTGNGDAYFAYFGDRAGPAGTGWYSYDAGAWHVVALNSVCLEDPSFCTPGEDQLGWLRSDLAAHPTTCLVAYWHSPLLSSGSEHGDSPWVRPYWEALVAAGAELVLNGDDHHYERFVPMDAAGVPSETGIRQFIVGTGGAGLRVRGAVHETSEIALTDRNGVLRLALRSSGYDWQFLAAPDGEVLDEGSGACR